VTQGASLTRDEARPIAAKLAKLPELRFSTTKPELRRHQSCVLSNPTPQLVIGHIYALHGFPQRYGRRPMIVNGSS
jgi:hypothetical protein